MFNNLARVGAMRVAVLGSGNFGSVIARNVARNLQNINEFSVKEVKMWVHDELVNGKSLVDIINDERVNVKYLPGVKLPDNIIATRSIEDACSDADILLFIVPHQYLPGVLSKLKGNIKPSAIGVSMIKSLDFGPRDPKRCSELIQRELSLESMTVLMGANLAQDLAADSYAEATLGCRDPGTMQLLRSVFESPSFSLDTTTDVSTVEFYGALKNVVALGIGFCEALQSGESSRAAFMRQGLKEMAAFSREFNDESGDGSELETLMLSCGVADLIATCQGGRNRRCGAAFVRRLTALHNCGPDSSSAGSGSDSVGTTGCAVAVEERTAVAAVGTGQGGGRAVDTTTVLSSPYSSSNGSSNSSSSASELLEKDMEQLWARTVSEVCPGMNPPGITTSAQLMRCLLERYHGDRRQVFQHYPLFTRIYEVAWEGRSPSQLFQWKH